MTIIAPCQKQPSADFLQHRKSRVLNTIQDGGDKKARSPTNFSPVTSPPKP